MNGINRINEHVRSKDFWTYCIMFVTDNNSFDKLLIDYLEYEFINKFKKSSYTIMNKDVRNREPNISIYDKPNLISFIRQIEFLLNAEGIVIRKPILKEDKVEYYYPTRNLEAKLYLQGGNFILEKGSKLKRPPESTKHWKSDKHYKRFSNLINDYIDGEKVSENGEELITLVNLTFSNPSVVASLISGSSENGWLFFEGLNELRTLDK